MRQKIFYILIINLLLFNVLKAQTLEELVDFADAEYQAGNYAIASKEYNRALFFAYPNPDVLSLKIANCYFEEQNYPLAIDFYNRAYRLTVSDSIKNESIIGSSFCYVLQSEFVLSVNELLNVNNNASKQQRIQVHFLKGISLYGMQDDSASFVELKQAIDLAGFGEENILALEEEFEKVYRYQKRYNPQRAYVMSGLLPGSGQLSVGAVKEGINSMLLVGGLYLVAMRVVDLYSFWDGVLTLFPWVQRYWMGGMDRAKGLAVSKIETKRYASYQKILELSTPEAFK